jgi:FRG domain
MPAVKVKSVDSLESYISLVEKLRSKRGKQLWYRGCGKSSHNLKPSLYRHKRLQTIEEILTLEKDLLARFRQRSIPFHSRPLTDDWEWLFLMQHYGVPTRLLDWSESPLMALFFAVTMASHRIGKSGRPVFTGDASIWLLDPEQWNKHSVGLKSFTGQVLTTDDPNASAYKPVGNVTTMKSFPIALYGSHNSQRIVAQRGVFVCFGKDTRPMETVYNLEGFPADCLMKLVLRKGRLPHMYEALRRQGITDSVVFPDLDGLAREIKRDFRFEV